MVELSSPVPPSTAQNPASPSSSELRRLISGADTHIDFAKLTDQTPFAQAGADSLDFFNVILVIEDAFSITIPAAEVGSLNTIDGMTQYLHEKLSP